MRLTDKQIHRLADGLLNALLDKGEGALKRERGQALSRIEAVILDNIRQEETIEKQARKLLEDHIKNAPAGVDQHRMLAMIKKKLAEDKDFPL